MAALNFLFLSLISLQIYADSPNECDEMSGFDFGMAMCMPLPMPEMKMRMAMLSGNVFAVGDFQSGPRGKDRFAAPNMFMLDLGQSVGSSHYVNLDFMGTLEKWTFPKTGYPLLLQVGEHDLDGNPFIDSQHPHSSPVMGLTLSDTIRLPGWEGKNHLKLSFAPRGEAGDGPIAFMHRETGQVNPDAPLGHHLAQDSGHISSTVFSASGHLGAWTLGVSTFHGEEPEPVKVDLPMGVPNSYSLRLIREFSPFAFAMMSAAYVKNPEHDEPERHFIARYSASVYSRMPWKEGGWTFSNSFILGWISKLDGVEALRSLGEEFLLKSEKRARIFGRVEFLERTPDQLAILAQDQGQRHFLLSATLGYTHAIKKWEESELGLGVSATQSFLPGEFQDAYGGNPRAAKIFLHFSGMEMRDF